MLPISLLLNEHGIIKLMIDVTKEKVESQSPQKSLTPEFIDTSVEFFTVYTDRCHHGKEERILFRELEKKQLSPEHRKTMGELISEHVYARRTVNELEAARKKYTRRKPETIEEIQKILKRLVEFYPQHIEKENTRFFYPTMEYFSDDELNKMVDEFLRFDADMIHIQYIETVERLMGRAPP